MHYRAWRASRSREVARLSRIRGISEELSFDVRMRRLRKSRRRLVYQRLTDNALWIVIFGALGVVVATELIAAVARA